MRSLYPADIAQVVIVSADASEAPLVVQLDDLNTPDDLIDAARERARIGTPREVQAVLNDVKLAVFAGYWTWAGRPDQ